MYIPPPPPVNTEIMTELVAGEVFAVAALPTSRMLEEWSATVGGSVYRGEYYFTHSSGSRSETYILRETPDPGSGEIRQIVSEILSAQKILTRITGTDEPAWTYSRMARQLNDWFGMSRPPDPRVQALVDHDHWHYHRAVTGEYPFLAMYDMAAAYWQMASRMKSPFFKLRDDNPIDWETLPSKAQRRWDKIRSEFAISEGKPGSKKLRLAFIGTNQAGYSQERNPNSPYTTLKFQKGKQVPLKNQPGALQSMGLMAVRCTFELCQIQHQMAEAVYSNSDCVMTTEEKPMLYWDHWGIKYRLKAKGEGHIRNIAAWKIGGEQTGHFLSHERRNLELLPDAVPGNEIDCRWHQKVLAAR